MNLSISASSDLLKAMETPDDLIAMQLVCRIIFFAMTNSVNPLAMRMAIEAVLNDPNINEETVKAYAEAGKHWNI